jgi:hypothetical protein
VAQSPKQARNGLPVTPTRDTVGWFEGGQRQSASWSKQEPIDRLASGVVGQRGLSEAALAHRAEQAAARAAARTDPRLNGQDARRRVRG